MLLSAGVPSDTEAEINRTIVAGKQLAGPVIILAFGIDAGVLSWFVAVASITCNMQYVYSPQRQT